MKSTVNLKTRKHKCMNPLVYLKSELLVHQFEMKRFTYLNHFMTRFSPHVIRYMLRTGQICVYDCKKCVNCLNSKRKEMVRRLMVEKKSHKNTYFVTLTYNEKNVPFELDRRHFKLFYKCLWHYFPFRYYVVGEYGGLTNRPHFHVIIFTDYDLDLKFVKNTRNGPLFTCDLLARVWKYRGFVGVCYDLNNASLNYTAMYATKDYDRVPSMIRQQFNYFKYCSRLVYADPTLSGFEKMCHVEYLFDVICFKKKPIFRLYSHFPPIGTINRDLDLDFYPFFSLKYLNKKLINEGQFDNKFGRKLTEKIMEIENMSKSKDYLDSLTQFCIFKNKKHVLKLK